MASTTDLNYEGKPQASDNITYEGSNWAADDVKGIKDLAIQLQRAFPGDAHPLHTMVNAIVLGRWLFHAVEVIEQMEAYMEQERKKNA